jgi:glycosyltransferase involved in cell wall biosynthesis
MLRVPQIHRLAVSIVICCHNGAKLLPRTLAHLQCQNVEEDLNWELVLIDNASTDNTELVARECWARRPLVPLRVVREPRLGLCYARERAFQEARYEIVSFVDDDNWVSPEWVSKISSVMSLDVDLGAIGSVNRATADIPLPAWFSRYCEFYACSGSAVLLRIPTMLSGAGMTIRKSAWEELRRKGFTLQLTGRVGSRLTSCEDLELGLAIKLAGWKIHIEPGLDLQHYMPETRLCWCYLRRLMRACGEGHVILDAYLDEVEDAQPSLRNWLRLRFWWWRFLGETKFLINRHSMTDLAKFCFKEMEANDDIADIECRLGRLIGLLRLRSRYSKLYREIRRAPWCNRTSPAGT